MKPLILLRCRCLLAGFARRRRPPADRSCSTTATSGRSWPRTASPATARTAPPARPTCGSTSATRPSRCGAIVPGKPDESELIERILSDDEAERDAAAEVAQEADRRAEGDAQALDRRGGRVSAALVVHRRRSGPTLPDGQERKLGPQPDRPLRPRRAGKARPDSRPPEADRRTLARRLSLDLTGLPPTPETSRRSSTTSRRTPTRSYVDKLLASPHWGEHRGRYWLDAARYADTHGIHFDNYREIWSYRDWVINAFNHNHAVRPVHDRAARRRPAAEPRRSTSRSPPASTAATSRPTKAARSTRSTSCSTPATAPRRRRRCGWA